MEIFLRRTYLQSQSKAILFYRTRMILPLDKALANSYLQNLRQHQLKIKIDI